MKHRQNNQTDLPELADEGWMQMKPMLQQHGLYEPEKKKRNFARRKYLWIGMAACLLLLLIAFYPQLNRTGIIRPVLTANTQVNNGFTAKKPDTHEAGASSGATTNTAPALQNYGIQKRKTVFVSAEYKRQELIDSLATSLILQKIPSGVLKSKLETGFVLPNATEPTPLIADAVNSKATAKNEKREKLPVQLYGGVGVNISGESNATTGMGLDKINLHPSLRVILPLTNRFSLHTGLYAMSAVHGRQINAQEKEIVNNLSANLYYKINTTSVIKATYFEVPLVLHYRLNNNLTLGTGANISKLIRVKVKEKVESYDYDNNLIGLNIERYTTNATVRGAYQKKVDVNQWDPRMTIEATWQKGRFMFSAGYAYGMQKSAKLYQSNGDILQYRNRHFKAGIQLLLP